MNSRILVLFGLALVLPGCAPLALGAGATVGVAAAQEGGLSSAATDTRIRAQINDLWFRNNSDTFLKLDLNVNQGRVLVTGVVQDPEDRVEAVRLAWQPAGVKQVINEIQVADSAGIVGFARDSWISTRLRTAMTFDKNIQSINYSIDTVQGVVYLIGTARNQTELNRVIEKARTIPDVKRVVSYVKMVGSSISAPVQGNQQNQQPDTNYQPMPLEQSDMQYGDYNDSGMAVGGAPQPLIESESLIESEPLMD